MKRRNFLQTLGAGTLGMCLSDELIASEVIDKDKDKNKNKKKVKAIEGSWFEFQHHSAAEGKYWNPGLLSFTAREWEEKIKEIAGTGMKYLVLLDVAIYDKSFYPSKLLPKHTLNCEDPLETVLAAADKYDISFFVSNGFFGDWTNPVLLMKDPEINKLRLRAMNEVAGKYAHHKSFYGWYYPNETGIEGYYEDFFINYVNVSSAEAEKLTPGKKTLIAPYGTRNVKADDLYTKQLDQLNVDFVAYQDEIGVEKTKVEESAAFYENLQRVHKKSGRSELWADVEVFRFEGKVYQSALLPAPPERVIKQLEAVTPFVEKILIYQYTGLINKPGTNVIAGHPDSLKLYKQLVKHHYLEG